MSDAVKRGVLLHCDGAVATITLNRPEKLNPLDGATIIQLRDVVADLEGRSDILVVRLTGAGKAFSAGGDLGGYISLYQSPDDFRGFLENFHDLLGRMENSGKIYMAVINGACVAGGLELLLACDVVVAGAGARIGDGHLNFGQLPGAGGSQRLARAIGAMGAKFLMLSGALVDAEEALRLGLVNRIFPDDELEAGSMALCQTMAKHSPAGLKAAKHLVNEGLRGDLQTGLRMELEYVHNYATTEPDAMEGLLAFRDKRQPDYRK
ncbi:MAG: enoyl-CoA hydratase/isomerase family protein [Rhodospirillaceae bacterium]|nr:enoyl-CoA hydratase/isomerase family protein [Rhodospirillaceae bacterium]MBT5078941.1 enoyl-CoA hydratase/isomerase family protein [Rhodospirillaceae bacterium]MBT5522950.1 enoyl-CoA hydratase/isomerase family protein [Rhodospirillaceae bacterium]MBT5880351.1 enoyl-CoA hydratase/isomerase family protein [Rhodospirillaceae bacterium]MBT6910520.1 enoyl-CoA hydratase/isomerase family protein [Rhodospirillaceae bacterium]